MEYLSFSHDDNHYAVSLNRVRYIAADNSLPETPIAQNGKKMINTVQFEKQVCQLLGMEELLGAASKRHEIQDLTQQLKDHEQDHLQWMDALEQAIRNNKEFALSRDPDTCKLGRWYNDFHSDDQNLTHLLKKFDQPHRRIHQLAGELLTLAADGHQQQALKELQHHRETTLQRLRDLFADARELVSGSLRPTIIMLQKNDTSMVGLKVETIGEVFSTSEPQRDSSSDGFLPSFACGWLKHVKLVEGVRPTIMVIDPARLGVEDVPQQPLASAQSA